MSTIQNQASLPLRPMNRRHSFSSFNIKGHRHIRIPTTETSHPEIRIPIEPKDPPTLNSLSRPRASISTIKSRTVHETHDSVDDETSESDTPSTPPTEAAEGEEALDQFEGLPPTGTRKSTKRRASTTYATNPEDIRRLLGDGNGTKFLQKYCCGDGCCMLEALPAGPGKPEHAFITTPDNDAFRFLGLNLGSLTLDTELTKIVAPPEKKVSFRAVRKNSISEKFPAEAQHAHDQQAVDVYPPHYMKPHPPYDIYSAPIHDARELTKPGAEKRTFHFDIDVTDYPAEGGVDFKVGGAVGVCPPNDPAVVEDIMNQLCIPRFQRDKPIRMFTTSGRWPTIWGEDESRELITTRRELLTWTVDVSSVPPTKPLFSLLAEYAGAANEKKILTFLASAQGQAAFCDLRTGAHITLQQLLQAFSSSKPPLELLCAALGQLMPRFYSLSNDPHVSNAREGLAGRRLIEIAVTIHETSSHLADTKRSGVGSGFLERIAIKFAAAEEQEKGAGRKLKLQLPMFRGLMSNPLSREFASDGPMVLIGAGVGMAPFRGFILNRLKNANCANKIWLIQGIRDAMLDEIYAGELGKHEGEIKKVVQSRATSPPPVSTDDPDVTSENDGEKPAVLKHGTAVDKEKKVAKYVQDEVRHQADVVWFVINSPDGRLFVCGSTKGMGEGVESALIDVAMDKGGLDAENARLFWKGKKDVGQYVAETW